MSVIPLPYRLIRQGTVNPGKLSDPMSQIATRLLDFAYNPRVRWWAKRTLLPLLCVWLSMLLVGFWPLVSTDREARFYSRYSDSVDYYDTYCNYWTGFSVKAVGGTDGVACPLFVMRAQVPNEG